MKKLIIIGNPNTGKTTLFNMLTKSSEHTGNWHGVTVEYKQKIFDYNNQSYMLVDLPGIYSLSPNSYEEQVAIDYIEQNSQSTILCLVDSVNIRRNLYLAIEAINRGLDVIVLINNTSKILDNVITKNIKTYLGADAIVINANKISDKQKIMQCIENHKPSDKKLHWSSDEIVKHFKDKFIQTTNIKLKNDFYFSKLIYADPYYINKLNIDIKQIEPIIQDKSLEIFAQEKYEFIEKYITGTNKTQKIVGKSLLDKIVLNKFLCLPIFLLVMTLVFYITFFSVGAKLSEVLRCLIQNKIGTIVTDGIKSVCDVKWVIDLVENGIIGGVGTIFSFLPQVVLLFMFLSILEDSGYISRLAFVVDDIFSKLGLSGKSIYTLLMGFGCSTTACLTARNMSDKNSKIKTAILAPYMSCSAKLPIYAVIGGAFFGATNVFVVVGLYVLGMVCALVLSYILEKTFLKSKEQSFLMEFPSYKMPKPKRIAGVIFENTKLFAIRVGSLLVALNVIVWVLESFSFGFSYVSTSGQKSILETIGTILSPIFIPLGFGNWGAVSALLAGIVAKEMVVSALAMFNGVTDGGIDYNKKLSASLTSTSSAVFFTPAGAMSYMVFCLLYCPCVATVSVLYKEIGKKWTIISVVLQFVLAYSVALVTNLLCTLGHMYGAMWVISIVCCLFVIFGSFFYVYKKIKTKNLCVNCQGCVNCYRNKK